MRVCQECQKPIWGRVKFCSADCRKRFNNRRMRRGAIIYDLAMIWRKHRREGSMEVLCRQLGLFIDQDKEDGRKSFNDDPEIVFPEPDPVTFGQTTTNSNDRRE